MKKLLMCLVGILVLSGAAAAQSPTIGLFANQDVPPAPPYNTHCATGVGFWQFDMWIWCLPSPDGQMCAEFRIAYPANSIESTVTQNDAIVSVTLGTLGEGMSVCYIGCQNTWNWCFHQAMFVTTAETTTIDIIGHPDNGGFILFADCTPGYPLSEAVVLCGMQLNVDPGDPGCATGMADATWGAIKSLYK